MQVILILFTVITAVAVYFYLQLSAKCRAASGESRPAATAKASDKAAVNGGTTTTTTGVANTDNKAVLVLYGSQTGTAEMFAKTIVREGTKLGVAMQLADVEEYETFNLEYERLVILVCATYGEGEPTDSMKSFHEWIMDETRSRGEELAAVKFTVFGLGDRQYKYFCEEGIVMDRRFEELGAQRIYGAACGDAGGGQLEETFDEWRRDLWPAVSRALNITLKANTEEPVEPECRMKIWDEPEAPLAFPKTASVLEPTQRLPVWVPMLRNDELLHCQSSGDTLKARSTRAIEFSIADTIISYQAGDHFGILPCNPDELVADYLKILGVSEAEANVVFSLQDKKTLKNVFPARVTPRTALKWYIDLAGPPKKSTLRAFAHCCSDQAQKKTLLRILRVEPQAQKEYVKLCAEVRTMYGFLQRFNSAKVPLAFFLELMPRITPRYYSISSDPLSTPGTVGVTVSVVEGGLCTTMLSKMEPGQKLPVFVRKANFHLPLRDKERPVLMIGPGTGVAPFIGFLHRRKAWQQKGAQLGKAVLFFGCRRRDEDYIYEDFFTACLHDGVLSDLHVAFSREQANKVYVQHLVKENAASLWEMLEKEGANIYICGDAKHMAKDVEQELINMAQKYGNMSADKAKEYLKNLESGNRFFKDVWSTSL